MPTEALSRLAASVQPLVFETGLSIAPYSTIGTVFLVGYEDRAFVLAARHSLTPENIFPICVFPSDASRRIIALKNVFFVPTERVDDDFADLAVIEIDMTKISDTEVGAARLVDLSRACGDWLSRTASAELVVIGYPEEHSFVDYENEILTNRRYILHGRYVGPSRSRHLHELEVTDSQSLSTFSGLSGGPVFACFEQPDNHPEVVLCGMALRGTPTSRRIHFLDRSVLIDALKAKLALG